MVKPYAGPQPGAGQQAGAGDSFVNTSLACVAAILPTLATIAVVLRFVARRKKRTSACRGDDWAIWITLVMCWAHSINTLVAGGIGGFNAIKIPPWEYPTIALRCLWISSFFLVTALYTVKVSILLFYYHIFAINQKFKIAVKVMLVLITGWFISSMACVVLATEPIEASWNATRAKHRYNFNAWYITYTGLSILFDVVILCYPLPVVKHLKVTSKQKFSIMGIFWLGGFVCISAIVRFVFLYQSLYKLKTLNGSQYSLMTKAFIWAEVEPNTAVIAACLPTYGPFFTHSTVGSGILRSLKTILSNLSITSKPISEVSKNSDISNASSGNYYELDKSSSTNPQKSWGRSVQITETIDIESQRLSDDKFPLRTKEERATMGSKI